MRVRELSQAACKRILSRTTVARIACARDGQPYVVPVGVVFDGTESVQLLHVRPEDRMDARESARLRRGRRDRGRASLDDGRGVRTIRGAHAIGRSSARPRPRRGGAGTARELLAAGRRTHHDAGADDARVLQSRDRDDHGAPGGQLVLECGEGAVRKVRRKGAVRKARGGGVIRSVRQCTPATLRLW